MNLALNIPQMHLAYGHVLEVGDPDGGFRVKIKLHHYSDADDQDYAIWARVATPIAGAGYGVVMLPDAGDEVLVGFVGGNMTMPVVIGSLYNGSAQPADEPVDGSEVKRWTVTGHRGTRIAIDEADGPSVTLETPGGVMVKVSDDGAKVTCTNGTSSVTIESAEISVETPGTVKIQASQVQVSAPMVTVDAAMSIFSGLVKCDVLQTNTVIATTYTPGAGNIW